MPRQTIITEWCCIESIVAHRRNRHTKTLQFKVRWAGYGPSQDTWEPIENLEQDGMGHYIERYYRMRGLIKGLIQLCATTRRLQLLEERFK